MTLTEVCPLLSDICSGDCTTVRHGHWHRLYVACFVGAGCAQRLEELVGIGTPASGMCLQHSTYIDDSDGFPLTRRSRASCVHQGPGPKLPNFEASQPSLVSAVAFVCTLQPMCALWLTTCTSACLAMAICGTLFDSNQGHE